MVSFAQVVRPLHKKGTLLCFSLSALLWCLLAFQGVAAAAVAAAAVVAGIF